MERKIVIGIPAMTVPEGVEIKENGTIENIDISDPFEHCNDIWCDFSLEYYEDDNDKHYYLSFETMLGFDSENGCRKWIERCLNVFTEYMEEHHYDTSKELDMYEVFTEGINVRTKFKTIEEAYAFMKFVVNGFHGKGVF